MAKEITAISSSCMLLIRARVEERPLNNMELIVVEDSRLSSASLGLKRSLIDQSSSQPQVGDAASRYHYPAG